jgi:undecaprenyl-diphosphatase
MFGRLRPSHELGNLVHLVNGYTGGRFGFVSSHAANAFGFAMFSSLIFRFKPYTVVVFLWALVNSYSRIYLGVHYPLDIICGALVGISCALLVYLLYCYLKKFTGFFYKPAVGERATSTGIAYKNMWLIISMLLLTVYFIIIFSVEIMKFNS